MYCILQPRLHRYRPSFRSRNRRVLSRGRIAISKEFITFTVFGDASPAAKTKIISSLEDFRQNAEQTGYSCVSPSAVTFIIDQNRFDFGRLQVRPPLCDCRNGDSLKHGVNDPPNSASSSSRASTVSEAARPGAAGGHFRGEIVRLYRLRKENGRLFGGRR